MEFFKNLGKKEKIYTLLIFLFIIGSTSILFFYNPSITGYVPATYAMNDLEVIVMKNQSYVLASKNTEPLELNRVLISGKILGEGEVKIFLESLQGNYLIKVGIIAIEIR